MNPFVRLLLLVFFIWLAGAFVLRWAERHHPESGFDSIPNALWNIAVYLFSGLDSGQPGSGLGRITATVLLVLSAGVVAILTGEIASFLVERRLGSKRKMPDDKLRDHIVICNWNRKGLPMVRELHAKVVRVRRPIVVVCDKVDDVDIPEADDSPEFEGVYLVKGDPTREAVLRRARVNTAHSVVLLADPEEGHLADAKSILIVMAIRNLCKEQQSPQVHICVEGISSENVDHLRRAGADEIISADDFAMMLLSQTARFPNLGRVYRDLLTNSEETNEIYFVPIPPEFVGKSFDDLGDAVAKHRDSTNPSILIGIKGSSGVRVNPKPSEAEAIAAGDEAIVLAFERPDRLV
jgi:voltage-gated potassium channel